MSAGEFAEYLKYGAIGLAAIGVVAGAILLFQQGNRSKPSREVLNGIYFFMVFCVVLAAGGYALELTSARGQSGVPTSPTSDRDTVASTDPTPMPTIATTPIPPQSGPTVASLSPAETVVEPDVADLPDAVWIDTGAFANWQGHDLAFLEGNEPHYFAPDGVAPLCNLELIGRVATCFTGHRAGEHADITVVHNNVARDTQNWCAYKLDEVTLETPIQATVTAEGIVGVTGIARVFVCGRPVLPPTR